MTAPRHERISVIIGVYNAAPYIGEAIDSVLEQTVPAAEVIVVDDGSDDDSAAVAERYGAPVRCLRQGRLGIGAARNRGVEESTGDYLAFLDADDRFRRDKLERQLAVLREEPGLDVVFGHVTEFVSPDLDAATRALLRAPHDDVPWPTTNLMLVKRDSFFRVGLFSTDLKVGVGVDWCARAGEVGLKSAVPEFVVLERRLHADNNGIQRRQLKPQYLHVLKASLDRRRQTAEEPNPPA